MDRETFQTMWEMSANEAKGCFLRLPQTEYYAERSSEENVLEVMPDVCRQYHLLRNSVLMFGSPASFVNWHLRSFFSVSWLTEGRWYEARYNIFLKSSTARLPPLRWWQPQMSYSYVRVLVLEV